MGKRIQKILKEWKEESGVTRVVQFKYRGGMLTIYTSQPGRLIGRGGISVDKYRGVFEKEFFDFKELKFEETDTYWA